MIATVIGIGIRDLYVFILCWFTLPAVQFCGYICEKIKAANNFDSIKWYVFGLGGLIHSGVFTIIAIGVITNRGNDVIINNSNETGNFYGWQFQSAFYFASYIVFPIIAALYLADKIKKFWFAEICYISASITAKTSMFWLIISTTQEYLEKFGAIDHNTRELWDIVRYVAASFTVFDLLLPFSYKPIRLYTLIRHSLRFPLPFLL